jgi:hypothetical protein
LKRPARAASRSKRPSQRADFSGPEAAQIAAHNTRDRKEIHTPSEVLAAHRQIAAEFGNQADHVVAEAGRTGEGLSTERVPDAPQRAQEAVSFAKDRSFEREAVTDERDIMRDALRRGMGDLTYEPGARQLRSEARQPASSKSLTARSMKPGGSSPPARPSPRSLATINTCNAARIPSSRFMPKEQAAAHANTRELPQSSTAESH